VTLVEMLVAVALLVLMMTVIVTIFKAATGAVNSLQAYQELDGNLRQLDSIIRQDLNGVTARMTPPLNPKDNLGYFEYIENQFADVQGEDSDDCIRFTAKAPEGQLFTGRAWNGVNTLGNQPVVISSQYAEIIYFLRDGNLYRRVLLIAPDRQNMIQASVTTTATTVNNTSGAALAYAPDMLGNQITSWQGVNDLSARPSELGSVSATTFPIRLNSLGDLTNRENRFAYQRFANDFLVHGTGSASGTATAPGDGIADDENAFVAGGVTNYVGDGIPDYYPSLYYGILDSGVNLIYDDGTVSRTYHPATMAFPYVYPGAYSQPDGMTGAYDGVGWIHSTDPSTSFSGGSGNTYLDQLLALNHSPLELGDSLNLPQKPGTWWGFPTWRETMSSFWTDPGLPVAAIAGQPAALTPLDQTTTPPFIPTATPYNPAIPLPFMESPTRIHTQVGSDGAGSGTLTTTSTVITSPQGAATTGTLWPMTWEDDLVMTGVRSFDVKVYDNTFPGYVDLGWGDDLRLYLPYYSDPKDLPSPPPLLTPSFPLVSTVTQPLPVAFPWPPTSTTSLFDLYGQTFAHEGRIPPLINDMRIDAQFPNPNFPNPPYPAFSAYTGNVGDGTGVASDKRNFVTRLRRVWDSWSTEYTNAPARGFDPQTKLPIGPPFSPPVYPSFPPPYPAPLRGLQIQIRVVNPKNSQTKVLTIRQDFSDKL